MLDMTGKSLFPTENKKILKFFLKTFFEFFLKKKLRKRRIVPKNEKGGPFPKGGGSFETLKIFEKNRTVPKKIERGTFWSLPIL